MPEPILDVQNLCVYFQTEHQQIRAVDGVSFQLQPGSTLGIVGESGSGKSVTSLALMRLVPTPPGKIVAGEVLFRPAVPAVDFPVDLLQLPLAQMQTYRGRTLAMVFQEPMSSLNPVYSIGFQLVEALQRYEPLSKVAARHRAVALLQEVKLIPSDAELRQRYEQEWQQANQAQDSKATPNENWLQHELNQQKLSFLDRYPHQLSGGQIQRVMIALALCGNPAVLIADEPTTALDVTVQATILELLRELRDRRQMAIIFVTHDLGIIAEIADTVAVMYQGKIVETGPVEQIFSQPRHPYTKGLLACRPQPQRQLQYLPVVADFMEVVPDAEGKPQLREKPTANAPVPEVSVDERQQRCQQLQAQEPLLQVQNLRVLFPVSGMFGQTRRYVSAVNNVSFQVYPGETLGLVGESGCGKTTLGRALLRLVEPSAGQIWFAGQEVTRLSQRSLRRLRRNLQIIFQDPYSSLDPRMSVGAAVMEPLRLHQKSLHQQSSSTPLRQSQIRDRAAYLLERVGLSAAIMSRYPHEFSGGQRQRICIARALALNPQLVICDESVSALDVSVQAQVLNLLKELQAEFQLTYIFISHDLSVVKFMSDRIMVMNRGQIEEIGPAESIYTSPQTPYTQQLIAAIPKGVPVGR